jgi:ABC-2 type transport system permease protein
MAYPYNWTGETNLESGPGPSNWMAAEPATGWGMLVTSMARTPGQVGSIGTAIMLTFGILGGTFIQTSVMPSWFQWLSRITPNAWGLDGFTTLGLGGSLVDLGKPLFGLAVMGVMLFVVSIFLFGRRSFAQK